MAFCIGVKIQARNENFINPTIPTRDEIRKCNYLRRRSQLNSEGFHSKIWKPFVCIGHPLELDPKSEVIVSLDGKGNPKDASQNVLSTTDNVRSFRSKKPQNDIFLERKGEKFQLLEKTMKEEIKKSDQINFNVRMGQSFFGLIQKEKEDKINEAILHQKIKNQTELKAPQYDTDSDSGSENVLSIEGRPSRLTTSSSKSRIQSRPFTPVYNNISSLPSRAQSRPKSVYSVSTHESESFICGIEETSLYRQLCALNWLLEAMVRDDLVNMSRISLSWTLKNFDNGLTSAKNKTEIKTAWDKFVVKSVVPNELSKRSGSVSHSRLLANIPSLYRTAKNFNELSSVRNNENDLHTKTNSEETEIPLLFEQQQKTIVSSSALDNNPRLESSKIARRRKQLLKMRSVCDELDKDHNEYDERKRLHIIRIGKSTGENCRPPKATKLLPEDHYSDKLEHMVRRNRVKSAQLIDEKMSELRENVKNMSEYRMTVCLNKYTEMRTRGAFHLMLKELQQKNDYHSFFTALDASKNKIVYADWFLDLEDGLKEYLENKRIQRILKSIRQYALITVTKISNSRLLSVLESLTDWEIRHPEISASIKFLTDHVVPMTEEDFQHWFNNTFPCKNIV